MTSEALRKTTSSFLVTCLLTIASAQASDTEVYFNRQNKVFPNVMFSVDTSGSMNTYFFDIFGEKIQVPTEYDFGETYEGPFDNQRFYTTTDARVPSSPAGLSFASLSSFSGCERGEQRLLDFGFTAVRLAIAIDPSSELSLPKNLWLPAERVGFEAEATDSFSAECQIDSGFHGANFLDDSWYANVNSGGTRDLYTAEKNMELDWNKIPFITVYTGNYLNYRINPKEYEDVSRATMQERVIRNALERMPEMNAGLIRMWGSVNGLSVLLRGAMDNSNITNRAWLQQEVAELTYGGITPLATTLLESMHYFRGSVVNRTPEYLHGSDPGVLWNVDNGYMESEKSVIQDGSYISPITQECQKNYVLLLTDGNPVGDGGAHEDFRLSNEHRYPDYSSILKEAQCEESCLDELGAYMAKADAAPWLENNYDLDGDGYPDPQTIKVYPIGMETEQQLLVDTGVAAGTQDYMVTSPIELENAFSDILNEIKQSAAFSMVTAASSNDRFSKVSNRDFLYYGQFVPSNKAQWQGNLKKYRYAYTPDGVAYITDTNTANPDITTADGRIISTARSYWSSSADGNDALAGGVVDRLKARSPGSRLIRGINKPGDIDVKIMTPENALSTDNAAYNAGVNAAGRSDSERQNILAYALGQDVHDNDNDTNTSEQRGHLGAIVRSSPVAVQYGGTPANPEVAVFTATTDGVLHAFDDETGEELWAIVMPEAYPNLVQQHDNPFSTSPWWGIDGALTSRIIDNDADGQIEADQDDKVYLYLSGGVSQQRWFMLDVTNAMESSNQATLVRRGKYDANDSHWDELGMAISKMVPISYRLDQDDPGLKRKGMVYANGWDPVAEFSYETAHTMGRGMSLYDAQRGDLVWQMTKTHGGNDMHYAFATEPTTLDLDGDGYTDLIYAVDVNARVWRFNVNNGSSSAAGIISGSILAELGKADTIESQRRTYKRLDAAIITTGAGSEVLLAIGTGDRMNPLSESVQDRLHVIRDKTATSGTKPTNVLRQSDFYDATANVIGQGSNTAKEAALETLNAASGWYIDLPLGTEKAISAPLISSGIANFSVYKVGGASTNPCDNSSAGTGLLYRLNVLDATPATDHDRDGDLTTKDRFTKLRGEGIPGDVRFHTSPTGIKTILVNRDPFINSPDVSNPTKTVEPDVIFHGDAAGYWFE